MPEEYEGGGVEVFAHIDNVFLGLMGVTSNTARAVCFLRRELGDICLVVNPAKTVALPPKGHPPTTEGTVLVSAHVRIANKGGG